MTLRTSQKLNHLPPRHSPLLKKNLNLRSLYLEELFQSVLQFFWSFHSFMCLCCSYRKSVEDLVKSNPSNLHPVLKATLVCEQQLRWAHTCITTRAAGNLPQSILGTVTAKQRLSCPQRLHIWSSWRFSWRSEAPMSGHALCSQGLLLPVFYLPSSRQDQGQYCLYSEKPKNSAVLIMYIKSTNMLNQHSI